MGWIKAYRYILLLLLATSWSCSTDSSEMENQDDDQALSYDFVVDQNGSGDFQTVQEALDEVIPYRNARTYIYIKNGTYKQILRVEKEMKNVTLIGESTDHVVLTYDNYASKINPKDGEEYGTSGSSSSYIYGDGFYAQNITFQNSSGPIGQALAVYINGDQAAFVDCRFLGFQDTMYGGRSRQYFKNCYIEGSTDFIFGPATAYFDHCNLFTKGGSAITAASTESYVEYGYIFDHCSITGTGENITTLGRPWRPYAAVAFLSTEMSNCIKLVGWDNWGNPDNETTARYGEFENTGAGADKSERVDWVTFLNDIQVAKYTISNVFKTTYTDPPIEDNWSPVDMEMEVNSFLEQVELD